MQHCPSRMPHGLLQLVCVFCCQLLGAQTHFNVLTSSLVTWISPSSLPLTIAVLPVGTRVQMRRSSASLLLSQGTLCPQKWVSRSLAKVMVELAPVSHVLADSVWKMQCMSTVVLRNIHICVCVYTQMYTHSLCSAFSPCCPALECVVA